jgi:hypothetical protein
MEGGVGRGHDGGPGSMPEAGLDAKPIVPGSGRLGGSTTQSVAEP